MKLIFVNRFYDPDISATSQVLTDLARDQAARGREVHVVTSRQRYDDVSTRLPANETLAQVAVHRVWSTHFGRGHLGGRALDYLSFYLAAGWRLLSLARRGDVLVAKTDPPLISVVAAWVGRRRGARLVNWLQDVFPEVAGQLGVKVPLDGLAIRLRDYSLRSAAANVVAGERMAGHVRTRPRIAAEKVHVIENWADGENIRPIARADNPLRAEWGLGAATFVVGYSGNMGRAHEFETILGACELLREDPDIAFLFIGAGKQRDRIAGEAARRGLANVRFQPYQPRDRLAQSLSVADAHLVSLEPALEGLVVPSKYYGIAAAGRPTLFIGDPEGEVARLVERESSGLAVRSGNTQGLASAIRAYRDNPELASRAGARARAEFESRHDRPIALAAWEQLLTSLSSVTGK